MAAVANPQYTYGETTTIKRSVVDRIDIVSAKAVPVLKKLSPGMSNLSVACEEVKYEWPEDLMPITSSLVATATISTNTTTFAVTAAEGEYFLKGMILLIDSEQVLVTTKGTGADVVTISRQWGSTAEASHAVGATVEIIGRAAEEGADAPDDSYTAPTMPFNYIQNFVSEVSITDWNTVIKRYGIKNPWKYYEDKKLAYVMQLVERQMFYGKPVIAASGTPGSFGGFEEYILAGNKNDISSAALTSSDIHDLLKEIFALVGEEYMPTLAICNAHVHLKVTSFYEPNVRTIRGETTGGVVITRVETALGSLDLLLSKTCPAAKMYLLNPDMIGLGSLRGEAFHVMEMARTGTKEQRLLSGTYTMEMRNPRCHGLIYGISTTA